MRMGIDSYILGPCESIRIFQFPNSFRGIGLRALRYGGGSNRIFHVQKSMGRFS